MSRPTILLVDDESMLADGLAVLLRSQGYRVLTSTSGERALETLRAEPVDVIVSDHCMPGMSGLEFLKLARDRYPDSVRIMLTGHADLKTAVAALNQGEIYRFLTKPCDRVEFRITIHLALERLELERENRRLLAVVRSRPELLGELQALRRRPRTLELP